jgi:hypothetical protein
MPNIDNYTAPEHTPTPITPAPRRRIWMDDEQQSDSPLTRMSDVIQAATMPKIEEKPLEPAPTEEVELSIEQRLKSLPWNQVMTVTVPTIAGATILPMVATGLAMTTPIIGGVLGAIAGASYILGREQQEK